MQLFRQKNTKSPEQFWSEYEEKIGEKILARGLAKYVSGHDEHPAELWGLAIASERSFIFHHFPQAGFLQSLGIGGGDDGPQEEIITIDRGRITSVETRVQKGWKQMLFYKPPVLLIRYRRSDSPDSPEACLRVESDARVEEIARALSMEAVSKPQF
jgi:hypothetical protein